MRDYAKVAPTYWTGETGKKIRMLGRDAQVVALYLITGPGSNWIGLYYLPLPTLCHEVGISRDTALRILEKLAAIGFAHYDRDREQAWVPGTAKFQIGEQLKPGDKRIAGIVKDLKAYAGTPFGADFCRRYKEAFCLPETEALASPLEGPPKPVTETEAVAVTVTETEAGAGEAASPLPPAKGRGRSRSVPPGYVISDQLKRWAMETRPDLDVDLEIEKFRDHEFKDPRSNWDATFRNWIRNARRDMARSPITPAKKRESAAREVYAQLLREQGEGQPEG